MIFHRCRSAWLLAIGAALVVSGPASADEYRNESRHFVFNFPDTWCPIPKEAMAKANALANQLSSGPKINYVVGFQRRGQPAMAYPYVFVQPLPLPSSTGSYEDIEKSLAKEFKTEVKKVVSNAKEAFPGLVNNTSLGTPVLDRTTNRVIIRMEMNVAGVGKIQGLSVGFLGSKDIVFLHCYALDADFEKYLPVFQGMFDSFKFDKGYAFTPGQGSSFSGGGALRGALIGGIIGGLVAVPVWLLQKRRKAQPTATANSAPVPPPPAVPDTGITTEQRPN